MGTRVFVHVMLSTTHILNFNGLAGHPAPMHIMRCENPLTMYTTCQTTGRHYLHFPFSKPDEGNNFVQEMFQFMCFGSCPGGLNRRPVQCIFTLEFGLVTNTTPCKLRHWTFTVDYSTCFFFHAKHSSAKLLAVTIKWKKEDSSHTWLVLSQHTQGFQTRNNQLKELTVNATVACKLW